MKNLRRVFTLIASVLTFSLFCLPNGNAAPATAVIVSDGSGNYTVANDGAIDQTLGAGQSSYLGDLVGTFDGNSKSISGLEKPLFNEIKSTAVVKDLTATTTANTFVADGAGPTGVVAEILITVAVTMVAVTIMKITTVEMTPIHNVHSVPEFQCSPRASWLTL